MKKVISLKEWIYDQIIYGEDRCIVKLMHLKAKYRQIERLEKEVFHEN